MGYFYLFVIGLIFIMIFPSLVKFIFWAWIISLVINLFRPRQPRRPMEDMFNTYTHTNNNQQQENQHTRRSSDIIDVEFTQRDAQEE